MDNKTKGILNGTWKILRKNKKLLILSVGPSIIIGILLLGIIISICFYNISKNESLISIKNLIFLFAGLIVIYWIYLFFEAVITYCAHKVINNENFKLRDGFKIVNKHSIDLFKWPFVYIGFQAGRTSSIGVISSIDIISEINLNVLTIFVVPLIILERLSLKKAIEGSLLLFKKEWGWSGFFDFSLNYMTFFWGMGSSIVVILFGVVVGSLITSTSYQALFAVFITVLWLVILLMAGIVVITLRNIFIVALYNYAKFDKVPAPFDETVFREVFK